MAHLFGDSRQTGLDLTESTIWASLRQYDAIKDVMFKFDIDNTLSLALVQPSFAAEYLAIVSRDSAYLAQWLAWPEHGKNQEFFARFIEQSLHDYAIGKSMHRDIECKCSKIVIIQR